MYDVCARACAMYSPLEDEITRLTVHCTLVSWVWFGDLQFKWWIHVVHDVETVFLIAAQMLKLPSQYLFKWSGNLGNLDNNEEIQPECPLLKPGIIEQNILKLLNSYSASRDNWCTATLWNRIMTAQCEGMGEVGSARYEPALLPPCPSIRVLSYSNCQRSTHSSIRAWQCKC